MNNRYQRQISLAQIGSEGQDKLCAANVAIVGCGGLAAPVLQYLVGAGVGHIHLIDGDEISLSNLHRQTVFRESDIGRYKAEVLAASLQQLNHQVSLKTSNQHLRPISLNLLDGHDIIIDAADNFVLSYLLSDYCVKNRIPLVSASVAGVQGHVGVFCADKEKTLPSVRAVFPTPPAVGNNCNAIGVTGPSVGIIGSIQAQEVIKIIIGASNTLAGKLLFMDCWSYQQQVMDVSRAKEPQNPIGIIGKQRIESDDVIIDVRRSDEIDPLEHKRWQAEFQVQVIHAGDNNGDLESAKQISKLMNSNHRALFLCQSGQRAYHAALRYQARGNKKVSVLLR